MGFNLNTDAVKVEDIKVDVTTSQKIAREISKFTDMAKQSQLN